jgi:hypothetical protein
MSMGASTIEANVRKGGLGLTDLAPEEFKERATAENNIFTIREK